MFDIKQKFNELFAVKPSPSSTFAAPLDRRLVKRSLRTGSGLSNNYIRELMGQDDFVEPKTVHQTTVAGPGSRVKHLKNVGQSNKKKAVYHGSVLQMQGCNKEAMQCAREWQEQDADKKNRDGRVVYNQPDNDQYFWGRDRYWSFEEKHQQQPDNIWPKLSVNMTESKVAPINLYGPSGVGKTAILKKILHYACDELKLFNKGVWLEAGDDLGRSSYQHFAKEFLGERKFDALSSFDQIVDAVNEKTHRNKLAVLFVIDDANTDFVSRITAKITSPRVGCIISTRYQRMSCSNVAVGDFSDDDLFALATDLKKDTSNVQTLANRCFYFPRMMALAVGCEQVAGGGEKLNDSMESASEVMEVLLSDKQSGCFEADLSSVAKCYQSLLADINAVVGKDKDLYEKVIVFLQRSAYLPPVFLYDTHRYLCDRYDDVINVLRQLNVLELQGNDNAVDDKEVILHCMTQNFVRYCLSDEVRDISLPLVLDKINVYLCRSGLAENLFDDCWRHVRHLSRVFGGNDKIGQLPNKIQASMVQVFYKMASELSSRKNNYTEALNLCETIRGCAWHQGLAVYALVMIQMAKDALNQGEYKYALELLAMNNLEVSLAGEQEDKDIHILMIDVLILSGKAFNALGLWQDASAKLAFAQAQLEMLSKSGFVGVDLDDRRIEIFDSHAHCCAGDSQLLDAIGYQNQALALSKERHPHGSLTHLGRLRLLHYDVLDASQLLLQSYHIFNQRDGRGQHSLQASIRMSVGLAHMVSGDVVAAIHCWRKARDIYEARTCNNNHRQGLAYSNLAWGCLLSGQHWQAKEYVGRSIERFGRYGEDFYLNVYPYLTQAWVCLSAFHFGDACTYFSRAKAIAEADNGGSAFASYQSHAFIPWNRIVIDKIDSHRFSPTSQEAMCSMIKKIYGEKHPEVAFYHFYMGAMYEQAGRYDEACQCYRSAVMLLNDAECIFHPFNALNLRYVVKKEEAIKIFRAKRLDKSFLSQPKKVLVGDDVKGREYWSRNGILYHAYSRKNKRIGKRIDVIRVYQSLVEDYKASEEIDRLKSMQRNVVDHHLYFEIAFVNNPAQAKIFKNEMEELVDDLLPEEVVIASASLREMFPEDRIDELPMFDESECSSPVAPLGVSTLRFGMSPQSIPSSPLRREHGADDWTRSAVTIWNRPVVSLHCNELTPAAKAC